MAHIKSGGAVKGNRDSVAKRLGVKQFAGCVVRSGAVLVRQRGTQYFPGDGCKLAADDTIFATRDGMVGFKILRGRKYVYIAPKK